MWRFRLSDEDRERYGGPEWVEFAMSKAADLDVDLIEQIEDATGYTLLVTLPEALGRGSQRAFRAAIWLARHIAGIHEPGFAQFKPRILGEGADAEWVDDVVPPVEPPNRAARRASTSEPKATKKQTARRSAT